MRFAVLILFYDCDQFILRTIANAAPHIEKIYVAYSPYPWSYNPEAREKFRNPSDPSILGKSAYRDRVELVQGDWATEEGQRNEVLDRAKAEGFDYLIIQDADEFFLAEDYRANLAQIEAQPDFAYYRTPWYQFWKSLRHILIHRYSFTYKGGVPETKLYDTPLSFSMAFALNLKKGVRFDHCRRPTQLDDYLVLDRPCYHLSYVMSDAQVERKIWTYGHTNQIDHARWLRWKWYGWNEGSRNLQPLNPVVWTRAVSFDKPLPEELKDFPDMDQASRPIGPVDGLQERLADFAVALKDRAKRAKAALRR